MTSRPSGGMCASCCHRFRNCTSLDFSQMRTIKTDKDGTRVVKCSDYRRGEAAGYQPVARDGSA